ncbi:MAG: YraN family protein [Patescibacteria group bacterium]
MTKEISKKQLGGWGESLARDYLLAKGWKLLDVNIRIGRGELDLVFKKEATHLVVVEVKTKQNNEMGEPADLVTDDKIRQIEFLVGELLNRRRYQKKYGLYQIESWQLDVVAVYGDGEKVDDIVHYENITMWS